MEQTMNSGLETADEEGTAGIKRKVNEFEERMQHTVEELETQLQSTRDRVHDLNDAAVAFIEERPLAAVGIAFGAGYLLGKLAASRWLA